MCSWTLPTLLVLLDTQIYPALALQLLSVPVHRWEAAASFVKMSAVYDEVEIEDMDYKADVQTFFYPCPCGDKFYISLVRARAPVDA